MRLYHDIYQSQQALAEEIERLTMTFEALGEQLATCSLAFPNLRKTKIVNNKNHKNVFSRTFAYVKTLISSSLLHLDIGSEEHEGTDCQPSVDNLFPVLRQCTHLHTLKLRACIRSSDRDFIQALVACCDLKTLGLSKHTGPLINSATNQAIAQHRRISSLMIHKPIDIAFLSGISTLVKPFRALGSLEVTANVEAALALLAKTPFLQDLHLLVDDNHNEYIFSICTKLKYLEHLDLRSKGCSITCKDCEELNNLTHLKHLHFPGVRDCPGLTTNYASRAALIKTLGRLPALQHLRISLNSTVNEKFLIDVGRSCQQLSSLSLNGTNTLRALGKETGVLFPRLIDLELENLVNDAPWLGEEAE